ncbi:MAG: radical SAM protein [Candidatus Desulfofervidaceae bacterium]|nr:radical SAM protein [Candidatus Desulfofervidaceae bacterium]
MGFSYSVIPILKKSRALHRAEFGCLKKAFALNVTLGCGFACVYCYARGYAISPPKGIVYLYQNLPELIQKESRLLPRGTPILFNTASECFQLHPDILDVTYRTMAILLHRGFNIGFLTKGVVPEGFKRLFSRHVNQLQATIDVVSLNEDYCRLFEPAAPSGLARIEGAMRLCKWGLKPRARIDPLIPFYSDTEESFKPLLKAIKECGIKEVILNYLQLRPRIIERLQKELPSLVSKLILSCFPKESWDTVGSKTLSRLIPLPMRKRGYENIKKQAEKLGLKVIVCRCKNPDLDFTDACLPRWFKLEKPKKIYQPRLFEN